MAVLGGPREVGLGRMGVIGTDGLSIRFLWTPSGQTEIAWDEVGALPSLSVRPYRVFFDFPVWVPVGIALFGLGIIRFFGRDRSCK